MNPRSLPLALTSLSLLAVWLGAAIFVAAVLAPAAFAVLPTRALAGAIVGRVLPVLFTLGILVGAAVAFMNQSVGAGRSVTVGASLLAVASALALLVTIRIRTASDAIGSPMDALDPADPRRIAFGRMHGLSVLLLGSGILAACAALVVIARYINSRSVA
jgi:hypothetical protein